MEKSTKFCESCGIPLKQDPHGGGTNADGTKSAIYCSYCYVDGKFTFEGNVKDFQEFCRQKMIEGGHSKVIAWLYTRGMSRLPRWKN